MGDNCKLREGWQCKRIWAKMTVDHESRAALENSGALPQRQNLKTVFVVGAGPAGLFAAQKIAQGGHEVIVLNRDIKPGGLAEYGIYPTKDKMKIGLRKQFAKVLSLPNVHYLGHVCVAETSCISIPELREFSPAALVFA